MMLIVYVRHFLNDEGMHFFNTWFNDCDTYLSKQDGFICLHRAFDDTDSKAVHIWLHFENREKMLIWGNSAEHEELIKKLDPYRTKPWEATWYDTATPRVEKYTINYE